jgi:CRISPR/Cas system-associated endoribonuclease Cas2
VASVAEAVLCAGSDSRDFRRRWRGRRRSRIRVCGHWITRSLRVRACLREAELLTLTDRIGRIIDDSEDSVRIYRVPRGTFGSVGVLGIAGRLSHAESLVL